ncbi:MAG: hypothetical protein KF773_21885 [Deltaproteobacteria bacterium]|nr:hypothetical protein [Deltaproteobacteria bacterium]MCW5802041.1 hypothetical protein [Deltaproteobacteria bacterium]
MHRAAVIAVLAGCWTEAHRPAPPAPARPAPPPAGGCTIRDRDAEPMDSLALTLDGETFATLSGGVGFDLRVTGAAPTARATAENDLAELEGDVALDAFHVRPLGGLTAGWLEVGAAIVRGARGSVASLEVELPAAIDPRTVRVDVPCNELTSVRRRDPDYTRGTYMEVPRAAPLSAVPGGPVVAHLLDGQDAELRMLERRGDLARVRIIGEEKHNHVLAWVPANALRYAPYGRGHGTGYGYGVGAPPRWSVSCAHRLPIFARSAKRGEVRVGWLKAGKSITALTDPAGPTVDVQLGPATRRPYVRGIDLARCPR